MEDKIFMGRINKLVMALMMTISVDGGDNELV